MGLFREWKVPGMPSVFSEIWLPDADFTFARANSQYIFKMSYITVSMDTVLLPHAGLSVGRMWCAVAIIPIVFT